MSRARLRGLRLHSLAAFSSWAYLVLLLLSPATAEAAVTATHLTSGQTSGTSATTASISPGANQLILAWVGLTGDPPSAGNPTLTGNGLTWVQVGTISFSSRPNGLYLFRAMGAAPTAGSVTINIGTSQDFIGWTITQFSGVDTSGTNGSGAVVQSATNNGASVSALTVTLAAFGSPSNATAGG